MFAGSATPDHASANPAQPGAETPACDIERQRAKLDRLGDLALELTEILMDRARAAKTDDELATLTLAISRAGRAVRQAVALHVRLAQMAQDFARDQIKLDNDARWAGVCHDGAERNRRQKTVIQVVARIAAADDALDDADIHGLLRDCRERFRDESLFDVLDLPVSEAIAKICADLGLSPDWDDLSTDAWAARERRSGDIGAPLAALAERLIAPPRRSPRPAALARRPAPPGPPSRAAAGLALAAASP